LTWTSPRAYETREAAASEAFHHSDAALWCTTELSPDCGKVELRKLKEAHHNDTARGHRRPRKPRKPKP